MSDKTKAICDLLRVSYTGPKHIETMIGTFQPHADGMGKKVKTGEALESAKNTVQKEEFIKGFESYFDSLSIEELKQLTAFYDSEIVEKYASACKEMLGPIFEAMRKEFIQDLE